MYVWSRYVCFNMTELSCLCPPGGAAGPRLSRSRRRLCCREHFHSSQSLWFAASRQKQNKSNGLKKFRQCTSCSCSSHPPAPLCWFASSSQMDVCRRSCDWTQPLVFWVPPSGCEGPVHTWNICLILPSSSSLTFAWWACFSHCQHIVHLLSSSFFPLSKRLSPES